MDRVEANLDQRPKQMVVDAGFTNQAMMEAMTEKQVDLIGALPERNGVPANRLRQRGVSPDFYPQAFEYDASAECYRCPAGKVPLYETQERQGASLDTATERGLRMSGLCVSGPVSPWDEKRAIVGPERTDPGMAEFQAKMGTPEAQQIYKQRAGVGF